MMIKSEQSRTSCFYGLRLIAIWGIVVLHTGNEILGGGVALCSFFFIVSGFLYKSHDFSIDNYISYVKKKIGKVFPIYWFCLLLYFFFQYLRGHFYIDYDIVPHIFLVQAWFPWGKEMAYLGMAWFLSSLLFCYLLSPIVFWYIQKFKYPSLFFFVGIIFYIFICSGSHSEWLTYISPIYRLAEYSIAMWIRNYLCFEKPRTVNDRFIGCIIVILWLFALQFLEQQICLIIANILTIWILYNYYFPYANLILGNRYVRKLSSYIFFIFLTHNVIGYHIAYYFISKRTPIVVLTSMVCGVIIGIVYNKLAKILKQANK